MTSAAWVTANRWGANGADSSGSRPSWADTDTDGATASTTNHSHDRRVIKQGLRTRSYFTSARGEVSAAWPIRASTGNAEFTHNADGIPTPLRPQGSKRAAVVPQRRYRSAPGSQVPGH